MRNGQELALLQAATNRGLLDLDTVAKLQRATLGTTSLPQFLLERKLLPPSALQVLLRELSAQPFRCRGCGREASFAQLHALPALRCPRCEHALAPARARSSRARSSAIGASATHAARRPGSRLIGPAVDSTRGPTSSTRPLVAQWEGRAVGPYTIQRELGRGANGVVFLARRTGLSREFALKVLRARAGFTDDETVKRFQREADVASKLNDPALIGVYDIGRDHDLYYYAMEYCPGEDLKARLRAGALPVREGASLVRELARAMHYAHELGVIHRDLKPANVILAEADGKPRITDFGLARGQDLRSSLTKTGDVIGTPAYMAPEQFLGEEVDRRADIYALGGILFEALTCQRAFEAATAMELAEQVLVADPRLLREADPELPAQLEAVCSKALAREPADRYATAAELEADLARFLEPKSQPGARPRRRSQRVAAPEKTPSRLVLGLAGALILVALGVVGVATLRGGGDSPDAAVSATAGSPQNEELTRLLSLGDTLAEGGINTADALRKLIQDAEALAGDVPALRERVVEARDRWALTIADTGSAADGSRDTLALEWAVEVAPAQGKASVQLAAEADGQRLEQALQEAIAQAYELAARGPFEEAAGVLDDLRPRLEGHRDLVARLRLERMRLAQRRGQFQAVVDGAAHAQLPEELQLEAQLLAGLALPQLGEEDLAIEALGAIYEQQPETALGLTAYANQLVLLAEHEQAFEMAARALELDPERIDARIALGYAIQLPDPTQLDNPRDMFLIARERVEVFVGAIERAPEHWRAHWGLYESLRLIEEARETMRAMFRGGRGGHRGRGGRGGRPGMRGMMGDLPDSLQVVKRVVTLTQPRPHLKAWLELGRLTLNEGQTAESVQVFNEIAKTYPQQVEPLVLRAFAWSAQGEPANAAADARRAIELDSRAVSHYLATLSTGVDQRFREFLTWDE